MNAENLVETLRTQHRDLAHRLESAGEAAGADAPDGEALAVLLREFRVALDDHLELEDNVFYPELLSMEKQTGTDTAAIETFVKQMAEIATSVRIFLSSYVSGEQITDDLEAFRAALADATGRLAQRLKSEEEFVYYRWSYLKS